MSEKHDLAGVIGSPIAHSLSPSIHGYWIAQSGVAATYAPIEVKREDLDDFFALAPRIGFRGFNVTAPYKEAAFLRCTRVSPRAERARSVNLVVFEPSGDVFGDSTDGAGFFASLQADAGFSVRDSRIAMIGAGGAARAIVDAAAEGGATEIRIANRTPARSADLVEAYGPIVRSYDLFPADRALFEGADLVIHGTPFGMTGHTDGDKPWRALGELEGVLAVDLIYAPLETAFMRDAAAAGARAFNGLGMLLHQAQPCFEAWFGARAAVDEGLKSEIADLLRRRGAT